MTNAVRRKTKPGYKRCAFTGYRPSKMPFGYDEEDRRCVAFKARLYRVIEEMIGEGCAHFLSGGAMGMDMYAAEAVVSLREKYPWVLLEMVSPFDGQADRWTPELRERRERLFRVADIVTVISHPYTKTCLFRRNRYLVDNADVMLAAYDGQPGGTAMTLEYARECDVPVRCLRPDANEGEPAA